VERQRYRCDPSPNERKNDYQSLSEYTRALIDQEQPFFPRSHAETVAKKGWHTFAPDLAREHVHIGEDHCDECEESRGVHRGEQSVARRQSWNLHVVAEGLVRSAGGESYAETSKWAWRKTQRDRTRPAKLSDLEIERRKKVKEYERDVRQAQREGTPEPAWPANLSREPFEAAPAIRRRKLNSDGTPRATKPAKRGAALSKNRWHTAADWVEMYSHVLWEPLHSRLLQQERQAAISPNAHPSVLLIDDIPVQIKVKDPTTGKKKQQRVWYVLGAATLTDHGEQRDFDDLDTSLRLLRAYATNDSTAWKLLFTELGFVPGEYEPDFIIADAGTGLVAAVHEFFTTAVFIPSLYHLHQALRRALTSTPGASIGRGDSSVLLPELATHLATLDANTLRGFDTRSWGLWWDELERRMTGLNLATDKIVRRRANYEPSVAAALPSLSANRTVPLSTGGFETVLRRTVQKLLVGRKHAFANVDRFAALLDLAVCKDRGVMDKTTDVVAALRADQVANKGWALAPRVVADPQPPMPDRYASLRDRSIVYNLAANIPPTPSAINPPTDNGTDNDVDEETP
jgi:hypothetical protein